MTTLSPRLQAIFEKTETVCFGRFLIDVPSGTQVSWGYSDVPLRMYFRRGEAHTLDQTVAELEAELKAEEHFPAGTGMTMYLETLNGSRQHQKTVISYEDFMSRAPRLRSFLPLGPDLFVIDIPGFRDKAAETAAQIDRFSKRIRLRSAEEIPNEPGNCVESAFVSDDPQEPNKVEHVRVGFRLKAFPDVHLSIYAAPANRYDTGRDSLKGQLDETRSDASKAGLPNPFSQLKIFREAPRTIHDWDTGYELLSRSPEEKAARSYHEFWMKFTGVAHDALKPYADIKLETGVKDNMAGAIAPSLSDEEAIALWDKLTSTIRVRPTGGPAAKTSDAGPRRPLGELAVTGRTCLQTGIWECDVVGDDIHGGRRRMIMAGETMPGIIRNAKPNLWEKLRGQQPTFRSAAMWKLVAYEDSDPT